MNITELALLTSTLSLLGFAVTLTRHIMLKRQLLKLKREMAQHVSEHGFDYDVWTLFVDKTRKMLSFW